MGHNVPTITNTEQYFSQYVMILKIISSVQSPFKCFCACMIQAHRKGKTSTRRKKEALRKEKVGRSGESKNQGTGNVFYLLYAFYVLLARKLNK